MEKLVKRTQFTPDMLDDNAFTFGYNVNEDGTPAIGEGVDDDPTIVGISTPCVVEMLRYAAEYVLHIDTTYKLDQSGYPVLVLGISDQSRSFHLVAMFVTSQQTGGLISMALQSVFDVFKVITGNYPDIRYCVADTDKAQYNTNVADRVSSYPMEVVSLVFKNLYMMHYSRDSAEFNTHKEVAHAE
ncbi:hypothetical protein F441_06840 [Phytophthora nicotianae CJ01A1]|uniref:Uncharacterized protein n=1 Tax=Phytophthora nicotianae CJ01A1 TaxID=1317063 RepID=W2X921_PHYNI|nr:hypothetical protein F441_06840 [Phytophthora nicotianae CJ01A1]